MADFHVVDPLDEFVDVFRLLGRIGIVDVIKINMHDAHRFKLLNAANRVGKGFIDGFPAISRRGMLPRSRTFASPSSGVKAS